VHDVPRAHGHGRRRTDRPLTTRADAQRRGATLRDVDVRVQGGLGQRNEREHHGHRDEPDQWREQQHRVPAGRGHPVARGGAHPVGGDGDGHLRSGKRRAPAHVRAAAGSAERSSPLSWGQSRLEVDNCATALGADDDM
jgi:hypothetical protein